MESKKNKYEDVLTTLELAATMVDEVMKDPDITPAEASKVAFTQSEIIKAIAYTLEAAHQNELDCKIKSFSDSFGLDSLLSTSKKGDGGPTFN